MQLGDRVATLISSPLFGVSGWNRGRKESLVYRVPVPGGCFAWGWRGGDLSLDYRYYGIILLLNFRESQIRTRAALRTAEPARGQVNSKITTI